MASRLLRLLVMVAFVALPICASAAPQVSGPTSGGGGTWFEWVVRFDGTTADSKSMSVTPTQCSFTVAYAGSGSVQLWQVSDPGGAASGGSQVGSTISAQPNSPTTFSPGQSFVKAVASVASSGTEMKIRCSNTQVSASTTGGTEANTPLDPDGDGLYESVVVQGDYDGANGITFDDIQAAVDSLTDTDTPHEIIVGAGEYGPPSSLVLRALLVLHSNTTLRCLPGATLRGYSDTVLSTKTTDTRLISNDGAWDPDDRTTEGDGLQDSNIHIIGCDVAYNLAASYDSSGWTAKNHFGVYLDWVDDYSLLDNTFADTVHSCAYIRSGSDGLVEGNRFEEGCGNSKNTEGNDRQQAYYNFTADGHDTRDIQIIGNTCDGPGADCYHVRAQFMCVGGTELPNTSCETDGSPGCSLGGTCTENFAYNITMTDNIAKNAGTHCYQAYGVKGLVISDNVCDTADKGIKVGDDTDDLGDCDSATNSDDAACDVVISGNLIQNTSGYSMDYRNVIRANISSNMVRNSTTDSCVRLHAPIDGVTFEGNDFIGCGNANSDDVFEVTSETAHDMGSLTLLNNTADHVGGSSNDGGEFIDIDETIADFRAIGNTLRSSSSTLDCFDFDVVPTRAYLSGNDCGGMTRMVPGGNSTVDDALAPGSVIVSSEDNGGENCGDAATWIRTGASGFYEACINNVWTAL